jgi:hypothetical protein
MMRVNLLDAEPMKPRDVPSPRELRRLVDLALFGLDSIEGTGIEKPGDREIVERWKAKVL